METHKEYKEAIEKIITFAQNTLEKECKELDKIIIIPRNRENVVNLVTKKPKQ